MSIDGELRLLVNPTGLDAATGARFLSRGFGTPWTETLYRWHLERPFDGEAPDRLLLMDGERAVGICGLSYRMLRTPDGVAHRVSIAGAGSTLPAERGRGHFARMMDAAIVRSALRGCTALLGFVTADNASCRALQRLGATEIASAYISSRRLARAPGTATLRVSPAIVTDRWLERAAARERGGPAAVFHYPDASAWRAQMVDRPHPVRALRIGATCRALIECVGDVDRLEWLDGDPRERPAAIRAIAARANRLGRRFFMYSTRVGDADSARRLGLLTRAGCLMAAATEARHAATVRGWAALAFDVQSGDRM
jgi:hypothetical protein